MPTGTNSRLLLPLLAILVSGCPPRPAVKTPPATAAPEAIRFCLREGAGHNCLLRDERVTAHLLATSGQRPRLVVAFPPENSGVAFWAASPEAGEVRLDLDESAQSFERDGWRGVRFELRSSSPLRLERLLLGSIRLIRDYHHARKLEFMDRVLAEHERRFGELTPALQQKLAALGAHPAELRQRAQPRLTRAGRDSLLVSSRSLDGKHRFLLRLQVQGGQIEGDLATPLLRAAGGPLRLQVEAASSLAPYRGLGAEDLLRPSAREHLRRLRERADLKARYEPLAAALRSLAFLSTDRKFMAGSWRFLTYFGRDTMMSLWLLRPALAPSALESGLQSVLDRLSPGGEVAHEESLGDQAVLERLEGWHRLIAEKRFGELERDLRPLGEPVYDYKMVDDDFMLALLFAEYLQDEAVAAERAARFLARTGASGRSNLQALAANLALIVAWTQPYAESGSPADLVPLKAKLTVGDWRDSQEGLGFGRHAASVNAFLAPAALRAAQRILQSSKIDRAALAAAVARAAGRPLGGPPATVFGRLADRWAGARRHFEVRLRAPELRERLGGFLRGGAPVEERPLLERQEVAPGVSAAAVATGRVVPPLPRGLLTFDALSLNQDGSPVEVMHTDDGFALLAEEMPADELSRRLCKYELAYPLGLDDRFGIYVANPALSGRPEDWVTFDRGHYHGTVVWSWQLILLERGLMRQLEHYRMAKSAQSAELAGRLQALLERIAAAQARVGRMRASELWTVRVRDGRFEPMAFGEGAGHADESNALQLWSDLNLAVDLERTRLGLLPSP